MTPDAEPTTAVAEAPRAAVGNSGAPAVKLGVWEGPLDLLLELARAQRVDLARISVTGLATQFVAVLDAAIARQQVPLSRLAELTIMAAWLLVLRSRLLLPAGTAESAAAEREAADLRRRLADRDAALGRLTGATAAARVRGVRARDGRAGSGGRADDGRDCTILDLRRTRVPVIGFGALVSRGPRARWSWRQ